MILVLEKGITEDQKNHIRSVLFKEGCIVREMTDAGQSVIGAIGKGQQDKAFFEGLPGPAEGIPYGTWVLPMLHWAVFLLALYVAMVCLAVIFRRQWMERERLAYPIAQVPLAMIRGEHEHTLVNRFFKNPAMWIGFRKL